MTDTNIETFLPIFASTGAKVAFLSPTPTGMEKSIMDAIGDVRYLLKESGLHDYDAQQQGPDYKEIVTSFLVYPDKLEKTHASLYRPITKKGDPRIWFGNLKKYCIPRNLLALIVYNNAIYVINLSNSAIADSLLNHKYVYEIVKQSAQKENGVARELLSRLVDIHNKGFLPSITTGDPGVGDTLENALGIERNNSPKPDYKGIELKATRITRGGQRTSRTRQNLFGKVPDYGMSYSDIARQYGKWTFDARTNETRLSLENTTFASHANSHGLILDVKSNDDKLYICHMEEDERLKNLSYWMLSNLRKQLLIKHHETFWVKAQSIYQDGIEWFRYDFVTHTKNPNDSLFASLLETDKIMVDFVGYFIKEKNMKWRDHGLLFKMWSTDFPLLFGEPAEYDLSKISYDEIQLL